MTADPRDDPRARDLMSADPSAVSSLARVLLEVAGQAQVTAAGLRGADHDASWTGPAADAFRQGLGKVPGDLDNVMRSYQEAADALNRYEGDLGVVKPAFASIASQLSNAEGQLAGARSQLSSAQSALSAAIAHAAAASPPPFSAGPVTAPLGRNLPLTSPYYTAVNGAAGAVINAQDEIAALSRRGFELLDEFDGARNAAKGTIASAGQMPPHRGFWDSVLHDVGNWMTDAGSFLVDVGKGIFDSVTGTLGAFEDFINHPSLASFAKLAGDVAVDASIVVLAAAAPEALGLVGAAEAAGEGAAEESIGFAARLASMGQPAQTVASAAGTASAADDLLQGHYADAGVALLFAHLPSGEDLAGALGVGEKSAEAAASTADGLKTYSFFTDHGFTPGEAFSLMSDGEVKSVLDGVTNIDDRAEVAAATQSATAAAAQAAKTAGRIGAPLAFSADSIKDKLQDKTKEGVAGILHPEPDPSCTCP
jgi:hypothetical protein